LALAVLVVKTFQDRAEIHHLIVLLPMVEAVVVHGLMRHQLVRLALWDQAADRLVTLMPHHIHLLLDRDIRAVKAASIPQTVLNILVQAVAAALDNKVALECIMIQIEDLRALAVKVAIMNGTVPMLQTQDGLLDQQHGDTAEMA
jgi:hypothetical protein